MTTSVIGRENQDAIETPLESERTRVAKKRQASLYGSSPNLEDQLPEQMLGLPKRKMKINLIKKLIPQS